MTEPLSRRVAHSRRRIAGSACIALLAFAFPRGMRAMPEEQPIDRDDPACITRVGSAERAALWGTPLDRIVTLRLPTTSVRASIDEMARRTGISVSYSADLLPTERSVCLAVERVPLGALLEQLLEGSALRAIVVGATSVVLAPTREAQVPLARATTEPVTRRTSVLDRVVVTGTPDGVAQRGSPFALDVVEGTTLSQHGVRTLGEALELSVPGIWTWATTAGSVSARFGSIRGASSFGVTAPKVYVDGIEVANPLLVMQLDANRVARVEIIRGPQGAALYGADAISGVVNVLTRYDGTTQGNTEVQLSSMVGVASASLVGRDPFVQDHAITLRTGTAARSLSAGINAGSVGEYLPGAAERRLLADINGRYSRDRAVWNGLVRFSRQEANASNGTAPLNGTGSMRDSATGQDVTQYTVGGSVSIMPSLRWTHTLISGMDGYVLHGLAGTALPGPLGLNTVATLGDSNGSAHRLTTRLRSVGRFDLAPQLLATVTLGAEQVITQESMSRAPDLSSPPTGAANNGRAPGLLQSPQRNALTDDRYRHLGGLMQGTLAWRDAWFASVGGRVERTVGATPAPQTSLLPMIGLAHVRDLGDWSFKTRAAYGTGIRPARSLLRSASWMGQASAYNGPGSGGLGGAFGAAATGSNLVTASAALEAERQRGTEVGVDLLAGSRFALHVTRFDQRADGLIQAVPVVTNALTGGGRVIKSMRYTLQNVGAITNRGWEFEGTTRWAGLSLAGTMSLVDSRVAQVAPGYRGELQVGDRMFDVPARTTSLSAMWAKGRWSISSSLSHASDWMSYDRASIGTMLSDTTDLRAVEGEVLRNYWTKQASVTRWRGALMWRVRGDLTAVMSGDNLFDVQSGAPDNTAVLVGRTLTFGIRTRF